MKAFDQIGFLSAKIYPPAIISQTGIISAGKPFCLKQTVGADAVVKIFELNKPVRLLQKMQISIIIY